MALVARGLVPRLIAGGDKPLTYRTGVIVRLRSYLVWVMAITLLLTACAPAGPGGSGSTGQPSQPKKATTIKIGTRKVPTDGVVFQGTSVGGPEAAVAFHSALITYSDKSEVLPRLSER